MCRRFCRGILKVIKFIVITILILSPVAVAWENNQYQTLRKEMSTLTSQSSYQEIWNDKNTIVAYTSGEVKNTSTVIVISPEYYEDALNPEMVASYNLGDDANYVVCAFKRGFKDPWDVARDESSLVKEFREKYDHIIIAGHSKAATINIAMLKYLNDSDYDRMVNISGPYDGTILAMPEVIGGILENKKILFWNYGEPLYSFYLGMFDGDLADRMIREDSTFLKELSYNDIDKSKFINVVAKVGVGSFFNDLWNFNSNGLGLALVDPIIGLNGDGMVSIQSQKSHMPTDVTTIYIVASHATSYQVGMKKVLERFEKK